MRNITTNRLANFTIPGHSQDVSTVNLIRPGLRVGWNTGQCSHIFRLLRNRKVPWVLLENVPGLLLWHLDEDQPQEPAISYVVDELEKLGYSWAHRVISLAGFGLPQCRQRVFIVASLHGDPRDVLLSTESQCQGQCIDLNVGDPSRSAKECYSCFQTPPHRSPRYTIACVDIAEKRFGPIVHEIHTLTTSNGRRTCLVQDLGDGQGKAFGLHIEDAEQLSGFPAGWTKPCAPLEIPAQSGTRVISPESHLNKRFELLGLAVSVPQARWIGARLRRPYDIKFARSMQGKRFTSSVPGGALVDRGNRSTMNAWPKVAWNILDDDDPESWKSRYALEGCKDIPVICPFTPLGDFDLRRDIDIDAVAAKGYLDRVVEHDIQVPEFVQDALERVCGKRRRKQQAKMKKRAKPLDEEYAGELVWIPTKVARKQSCYWPGVALHLDNDRDLIPEEGLKALKPGQTSRTHRFAIYFGDKTFEWVKADALRDFDANANRLKNQKGMQSRALFTKALELAFDRLHKQTTADHSVRHKENEILQKVAESKLSERFGDLSDIPPTTCGKCNVCLTRASEREELSFSKRHLPRGCAKPSAKASQKRVVGADVCPQLQVCVSPSLLISLGKRIIHDLVLFSQATDRFKGQERLHRCSTCTLARACSRATHHDVLARGRCLLSCDHRSFR